MSKSNENFYFSSVNTDNLTRLKNREALINKYDNDKKLKYNVMIIDIVALEIINELYGYDTGNNILKQYSEFLQSFVPHEYEIYRYCSDKFALASLGKKSEIEYKKDILNILTQTRRINFYVKQLKINIDISVGISINEVNALQQASIALKKTKKSNSRFSFYNESMLRNQNIHNFILVRDIIKFAIQENRVEAYYHPIVNKKKEIIKYETLMRITENDNVYLPESFLKIAIKSKQYSNLSQQLIKKAMLNFENTDHDFSINICFGDVVDENTISLLDNTFLNNKNLAQRVIFEILECDEIKDYDILKEFVEKYKKIGVRFAIDDFGVGYSNFSQILSLKPEFIKIDGSLIKNIHEEKRSLELVKAIVLFSKALDIKIIAEYVHCKEIFDILCDLGIEEFQGFYFSQPVAKI